MTQRVRLVASLREMLPPRRLALGVLAVYLLARAFGALVILWISHAQDPHGIPGGPASGGRVSYWDMTRTWDGEWYRRIGVEGYPHHVPLDDHGRARQSALAFYPLYPMLVRGLRAVLGGSWAVTGSLTSLVLGALAAVLMTELLRRHVGDVAALCAVTVVVTSPPAVAFQMTYSESAAMVVLSGTLLALDRQWWVWAGLGALLLGFTRPIGVPLALVALVVVVQRWRGSSGRPLTRGEMRRMIFGLACCGISGVLWPVTAWALTGQRNAYGATMGAWRNHEAIVPFVSWFRMAELFFVPPVAVVLVLVVMVLTAALVAGPWASGLGTVPRVWCAAYALYLFATVQPWSSTMRYLLELFPLAAVLLGAAWRNRPARLVAPLATLVVLVHVGATLWWAWDFLRFTPPMGNPI